MTLTSFRRLVANGAVGMIMLVFVALLGAFVHTTMAQQPRSGRKAIRPDNVPNTGLPYTPGILAGNTLYISGNLGREPASGRLVSGGIEAETRQSMANIRQILQNAGMDFKDVVAVTAYISDFKNFDKFNAVYREYFPKDPPARATVQVAALNLGAQVELQMIAVK